MTKLNPKFIVRKCVAQEEGQLLLRGKFGVLVRQRLRRTSLSMMCLLRPLLCEVKELKGIKHRITSALSHVC